MISLLFEDHLKFSFFAYHIQNAEPAAVTPWNIGFTPMFDKKAATAAMMPHGMSVISQTRLMKQIQLKFLETYGEDKIVILLGGLHLEMALWTAVGKLLSNSGWDHLIAEANVTTTGVNESLLHASHLKRTTIAHELSLVAFAKLKPEAYDSTEKSVSKEEWEGEIEDASPTFFSCNFILTI